MINPAIYLIVALYAVVLWIVLSGHFIEVGKFFKNLFKEEEKGE